MYRRCSPWATTIIGSRLSGQRTLTDLQMGACKDCFRGILVIMTGPMMTQRPSSAMPTCPFPANTEGPAWSFAATLLDTGRVVSVLYSTMDGAGASSLLGSMTPNTGLLCSGNRLCGSHAKHDIVTEQSLLEQQPLQNVKHKMLSKRCGHHRFQLIGISLPC